MAKPTSIGINNNGLVLCKKSGSTCGSTASISSSNNTNGNKAKPTNICSNSNSMVPSGSNSSP
jgi:hypothetical protein